MTSFLCVLCLFVYTFSVLLHLTKKIQICFETIFTQTLLVNFINNYNKNVEVERLKYIFLVNLNHIEICVLQVLLW